MRVHVKQKNYQVHVRSQTLQGLCNNADGTWVRAPGQAEKNTVRDVYHGTGGKRSKGKGGCPVSGHC